MGKLINFIDKCNFKKIFIIYIIAAIVCGILCTLGVGYIYKDKISFAAKYALTIKALKNDDLGNPSSISKINELSNSSDDVVDILLLDSTNKVLYSKNETNLAWNESFELQKDSSGRFLYSNVNPDTAFCFVKKDEFMLSSIFADDFSKIYDEYEEETFYSKNIQNKQVYMLSLLRSDKSNNKIYVISNPKSVTYGELSLKTAAAAAMLLFMVYWILVALWIYQNARKSSLPAAAWGILTLFTNLAGVLIYTIYKYTNAICQSCGTVQSRKNTFCIHCGHKIGISCRECGEILNPHDSYCPTCGHKTEKES